MALPASRTFALVQILLGNCYKAMCKIVFMAPFWKMVDNWWLIHLWQFFFSTLRDPSFSLVLLHAYHGLAIVTYTFLLSIEEVGTYFNLLTFKSTPPLYLFHGEKEPIIL